jgi:hypothetical protein
MDDLQWRYFFGLEIGLRAARLILERANKRRPHATLAIMDALREIEEKAQSVADYIEKKDVPACAPDTPA